MQNLLRICCVLMFCTTMNMVQPAYAGNNDDLENGEIILTLEALREKDLEAYNRYVDVLSGNREKANLKVRVIRNENTGESYMFEQYHHTSGKLGGTLAWAQYHIDKNGNMTAIVNDSKAPHQHKNLNRFQQESLRLAPITPKQLDVHVEAVKKQREESKKTFERNQFLDAMNGPASVNTLPTTALTKSPIQEPTVGTTQSPTQVAEPGSGSGTVPGTVSGAGPQPSGDKGDIDSMRRETVERAINASSAQDRQDAIDKVKAAPGDYVSTLQKMLNNAKDANSAKTILDVSARSGVTLDQYQAAQGFVSQLIDLLEGNDGKAALGPLSAASTLDENISRSVMGTAVQLIRERLDTAISSEEKAAVYKLAQEAGISIPAPTAPTTSPTPAPTPPPTVSPTPSPTPSPTESRTQLPIQTPSNPALSQAPSLPGRVPSTRELGQRSVAKSRSKQRQVPSKSSAQTEDTKRYKVTGDNEEEKVEMK